MCEICLIADIDKKVDDVLTLKIAPIRKKYEAGALKVNGLKWEDILKFENPQLAYNKIVKFLEKYMPYEERGYYNNNDKFVFCAYNIKFDLPFLESFFRLNKDYKLNRFYRRILDPYFILSQMQELYKLNGNRFPLKNLKLGTVCEHYGVELNNAHTAEADTMALRELTYKIAENFKAFNFGDLKI